MKYRAIILIVALLLLTGCASRYTSRAAYFVLPRNCVTEMRFAKKSVCHPRVDGWFDCDGLVVQAACLKKAEDAAK